MFSRTLSTEDADLDALCDLVIELAADVIRTAIAPTWSDIGQLASIAAIRTFLSYFLDKDIEKVSVSGRTATQTDTEVASSWIYPRHLFMKSLPQTEKHTIPNYQDRGANGTV